MTSITTIRAQELGDVKPDQGVILDVRSQMEHEEKHIGFGHAHVPLDQLNPTDFMLRHGYDRDADVYILCRSGKRATQAAEKFAREGYRNIKVVEGGLEACEGCGHAIKGYGAGKVAASAKSAGPISLERQVRIVAGSFAAVGAALGFFVNPLFTLIPMFVGCGLVFAGVTDRCGMALVLTKAPWNKTAGVSACATTSCSAPSSSSGGNCAGTASSPAGAKVGQSCQ